MPEERIHPETTRRGGYRYTFTAKHHGGGSSGDARWTLNDAEEFSVFDGADFHQVADDAGNLYGVLPGTDGSLRELGTWAQQVAEFPAAADGVPWHGYPIWSVNDEAPDNRRGERMRPAKEVFVKMEGAGLITRRQRKRLLKGDHA
ncbi:MAG: hypothetical protein ACRC33_18570 [Gemmataceae bacterium]